MKFKRFSLILAVVLVSVLAMTVGAGASAVVVPNNTVYRPYIYFQTSAEENWSNQALVRNTDSFSSTVGVDFVCAVGFGRMGTVQAGSPSGSASFTNRISYNSTFPFCRDMCLLFAMYDYSIGSDHYYSPDVAHYGGSSCDRIVIDTVTWEDGKMVFYVRLWRPTTLSYIDVDDTILAALNTTTGYRGVRLYTSGNPRGSCSIYTGATGYTGLRIADNNLPGTWALGEFAFIWLYTAIPETTGLTRLQSAWSFYWYTGYGVTLAQDQVALEYGAYSLLQFVTWFKSNAMYFLAVLLGFGLPVLLGRCLFKRC